MDERALIGALGLVVLFGLIAIRLPVALAMVLVGVGGNYALSIVAPFLRFEPYLAQFKTLTWSVVSNYALSVVPLFIFMGFLAAHANLSRDLFQGLNVLVGRWRGGVAMAAVLACAGFGAVCGSSLATASTMGRVALPELKRLNYADGLATGALAAGGTLGILIPPSVALVVYAIVVEASVVAMFQAAILPGVIAVALFVAVIAVRVRLNPALAASAPPLDASARRAALRRLIPVVTIFSAVIVGLGLGLFTPTPAGAVGVFAVLVYGVILKRCTGTGLGLSELVDAVRDTAVTAGMIGFILFGAEVLKGFFARSGLPAVMADWAASGAVEPWTVLVLMLLGLIVLGCFMDSLSMILVVVPFLFPVLMELNGGDWALAADAAYGMGAEDLKIWFGILALVVVELGLITPPVGLNVFIIRAVSPGVSMGTIFRGVLPFFGVELGRVALILAVPGLALWLPRLLL
ncbi:TRAP transporter large permease [Roseospira marina]|uniref:TRAP transporter large permease n=1 Tax=Roseospira marina TaxID=140057 RepID=A0A5M6IAK1_9PROT|nr:TRAP transporter large permease [Roseospira marina]KAA5604755.1 TRAP transporter large permease [Roseospira marina]MBB4313433.1 tripartite ATP-independent transporter DctM subunit [Roseospira marina]MBB5086595.1 tripartite ATP-independent transporter DctM subunit [Roseospira marina]